MKIAFIGHHTLDNALDTNSRLYKLTKSFIENDGANEFLFGSNSEFNSLSYMIVTELKEIYTNIRRIYVRAEYEHINDDYRNYLLTMYEDTFFPPEVHNAGRRSYIKRNQVMIQMCDILIVYYNENYSLPNRSSGTKIAVDFAHKHDKKIINVFNND